jgi:hypothetical protein
VEIEKEIKTETLSLAERADNFVITQINNTADFEMAGGLLVSISRARDRIGKSFDPIIKKAHESHKEAIAQKKLLDDPMANAEKQIRGVMGKYEAEVQAERQRAARAEQQRQDEERRQAQAKADEDRKIQLKADEDARLAHAIALEAEGKKAEAARVLNAPPPPPPPPVQMPATTPAIAIPEAPKAAGVSFRQNWKARVVDANLLIQAIAAGQQAMNLMVPNQQALDGIAKALKGEARIPGVEFYTETVSSVRA